MLRKMSCLISSSGWPGGGEFSVCCVAGNWQTSGRLVQVVVSQSACGSWWDSQPSQCAQIPKCLVPLSKRARFTSSYKARVLCLVPERNCAGQQQHAFLYVGEK
jgi:hypothetical protein